MSITSTTKHKARGTSEVTEKGYQRPSDWVSVPAMGDTEVVYFVVAIDDVSHNKVNIAFDHWEVADSWDVDWGDGTTQTGLTGIGVTHDYDFSTFSGTVTSEGFKTALITVTPSAGNTGSFRTFDISKGGLVDREFWRTSNFLEVYANLPDIERFYTASSSTKHRRMRYIEVKSWDVFELHMGGYMSSLEEVKIPYQPTSNVITTLSQCFAFCYNLKRAPYFDTSSVTNMSEMFHACRVLESVPLYDTSSVTDMSEMFADCSSLKEIPPFDTSSVTNMYEFAQNAFQLKTLPQLDTSSVTDMSYAFKNTGIEDFPNIDVSSVTNFNSTWHGTSIRTLPELNFPTHTADYANSFAYCITLEKMPDSLANINPTNVYGMFQFSQNLRHVPSFSLTNAGSCGRFFYNVYNLIILDDFDFTGKTASQLQNAFVSTTALKRVLATGFEDNVNIYGDLSGEAIDEIFTNLPTVTGKTITLTDHWGYNDATQSIATAKGWTVAGSDTD